MVFFDVLKGLVVGIILAAAGLMLTDSGPELQFMENVGWVFFIGGLITIGLSIFSAIKR